MVCTCGVGVVWEKPKNLHVGFSFQWASAARRIVVGAGWVVDRMYIVCFFACGLVELMLMGGIFEDCVVGKDCVIDPQYPCGLIANRGVNL